MDALDATVKIVMEMYRDKGFVSCIVEDARLEAIDKTIKQVYKSLCDIEDMEQKRLYPDSKAGQ